MPEHTQANEDNRKDAPSSKQSFLARDVEFLDIKAPPLASGLYLVATPIGNLRDITLRALDVLRGADHIFAEDTRQTAKLLTAYNITARLTAYHDHNTAKRIPDILKKLDSGASIALVSDAGTPLVSDPGYKLAREVAAAGHKIFPIPGASAALAGLLTSALPSDKFLFAGFLPPKSSARQTALSHIESVPATLIFFEAGSRIEKTLKDMLTVFGDRPAALARELTKKFEETRRGLISELIDGVRHDPPRGEIVLIIGSPNNSKTWDNAQIEAALLPLLRSEGVKRAANLIAAQSGKPKREIYAKAQALKEAGQQNHDERRENP